MHGSPGGTQLPSIRSLHPYLPPPPPLATSSMPPHQSNPNPNESDPDVDRDEESAGGGPGNTEPPKKKRRRQALSCSECKRRKIRCDRTQPCAPCVRRGDQAKCQWHIAEPVTERYVPLAEYETLRARVDALEVFVSHLPPDILASMPPLPSQASLSTNVPAASFVPSPSTSVPPIQSLPSLQSLTASSARQASFFAASPPPLQAFPPHVFHSSESGGILPAGAQMQPGRGGRAPRHSNASTSGSQLPSGSGHGREERASGRQVSGQPHLDEDLGPDSPGAHPRLRSPDQQRTISPLSQQRRVTSPSLSRPFVVPLSTDWTAGFSHGAFTPSPFSPPTPGPPSYPGTSTGSSGFLSPPPSSSGFGSDAPGRRGRGGSERGRARGGTNASGGPSFQAHSAVMSSLLPSTGSWGDGQTQALQSRSWSFSSRTSLFLSMTPRLSSAPRRASARSLYDTDGLGGGDPGPAVAVSCMDDAGLGLELRVRGKDGPLLLPGLIAAPSHLLSSLLALALEHPGADSLPVLLREANGSLEAAMSRCELGRRAVAICWLPRKRKARARRGRRHPKSGRSAR